MKKINRKHLRNLILKEMRNLTTEQLEDPKESELFREDLLQAHVLRGLLDMFNKAQPQGDAEKEGIPEEIDKAVGSGAWEKMKNFMKKDPVWSRWYQSKIEAAQEDDTRPRR